MCDDSKIGFYCGGTRCSAASDCYFSGCSDGVCVSSLFALVDDSDPNASTGGADFDNVCEFNSDTKRCIGETCVNDNQCASNYCV